MQYVILLKTLKSHLAISNLFALYILTCKKLLRLSITTLNKLSHYGTRDAAKNRLYSYLANRNQFVIINGFYSDP